MTMIVYREEDHSYWLGERRIPSVTQVLRDAGLLVDYGGVDPEVLRHARERGIHVEQCCRLWSEGDLDDASVHPAARPYLDAFERFADEQRLDNFRWQVVGYSEDDDVAGTADLLGEVAGRSSIVDVKATYKIDRSYRVQLTAYARMHGNPKRYVLQLKKDGTYVLLDCDAEERREGVSDEATWLAVVQLARWKQGNGRKP